MPTLMEQLGQSLGAKLQNIDWAKLKEAYDMANYVSPISLPSNVRKLMGAIGSGAGSFVGGLEGGMGQSFIASPAPATPTASTTPASAQSSVAATASKQTSPEKRDVETVGKESSTNKAMSALFRINSYVESKPWHPLWKKAFRARAAEKLEKLGMDPLQVGMWVEGGTAAFQPMFEGRNRLETAETASGGKMTAQQRIALEYIKGQMELQKQKESGINTLLPLILSGKINPRDIAGGASTLGPFFQRGKGIDVNKLREILGGGSMSTQTGAPRSTGDDVLDAVNRTLGE